MVFVNRLECGGALLPDTEQNVFEVCGILESYGIVLDAYWKNLLYISEKEFLVVFPFFKYFNGKFTPAKLVSHLTHKRINYEFAEYCAKTMLWHGGGGLDAYLESPEFLERAESAIQAKFKGNFAMKILHRSFREFLLEWVRQACLYSVLGQFWRVMSPLFLNLAEAYKQGKIETITDVVDYIRNGLVEAAAIPIIYSVNIGGQTFDIIPESVGLTFLADAGVPYVEAIFLRSLPFMGTVSYNAQIQKISPAPEDFSYGALFADPLMTGAAGIPPTLLMQDMDTHLPADLRKQYLSGLRGEEDLRVQICIGFQKSMCCVTTAAIQGLAPYPLSTLVVEERRANRVYLEGWLERLKGSCVDSFLASRFECQY